MRFSQDALKFGFRLDLDLLRFRLLGTGVVEMEFVIDCGNRGPIGVVQEGRNCFRNIDGSNL
jgi:hypothetical protein